MLYIVNKIIDNIKKYGMIKFFQRSCIKIFHIISTQVTNFLFSKKYKNQLLDILLQNKDKKIFILYPFFDFNMPNFQRFQQMAIALGKRDDVIFFYSTPNNIYDSIYGFKNYKHISENLYITNQFNMLCNVKDIKRNIIFVSTDTRYKMYDVEDAKLRNDTIIYDFVDDIHEDIVGKNSISLLEKHKHMILDKDVYVIPTSQKLLEETLIKRKEKVCMITNGVNIEDFNISREISLDKSIINKIKSLKKSTKVTICYYGALAKWFDYELIKYLASYKDIGIVLIGVDYDKSLKNAKLNKYSNILYLGIIDYYKLKYYVNHMDILVIPFIKNSITNATSPVKLFEYMALKKPIITTDLDECKKYKSVNIAKSYIEFKDHIDRISKFDEANMKILQEKLYKEAILNSWDIKAQSMIEFIK